MSTRTAFYAVVAAVSLVLAGVQTIGADEGLAEAAAIGLGLGQRIAGATVRTAGPAHRVLGSAVVVSHR